MSLVSQPHASSSSSSTVAAAATPLDPPTPLRPITSAAGFTYPAIWSFPPFFTLQPNPSTQSHQVTLWAELILSWARHHRVWSVDCDAVEAGEVFRNKGIDRRLMPAAMKVVLGQMAKDGQAVPDPPKQTATFLLYWRRPEEWGGMIYDWVTGNGLGASIMTMYEITDDDLSHTTDFHQLDPRILRRALETLVKRGKAQIIKGEGEMGEGVRFL